MKRRLEDRDGAAADRDGELGPVSAQREHGAQQITQPDAQPQQRDGADARVRERADALRVLRLDDLARA